MCKTGCVQKLVGVKLVGVCGSWRVQDQKLVKLVDACGMAVRAHARKAASADKEQEWEVLVETLGRKSGRLEPTPAWNRQKTVEILKYAASQGDEGRETEEEEEKHEEEDEEEEEKDEEEEEEKEEDEEDEEEEEEEEE